MCRRIGNLEYSTSSNLVFFPPQEPQVGIQAKSQETDRTGVEKERDGDAGRGGYLAGGVLAGGGLGLHLAPAAGHLDGRGAQ